MRNGKIITAAIVLLFGLFFFTRDARAQTATAFTSIDYDQSTNIVDAYSETDEDYDVEAAYGAYVSLSVTDQNWNLMGSQTATDDGANGFAAVEIQFFGSPDMTYTARGMHKALAQQYDYDYQFWPTVTRIYYDPFYFSSFENQNIVSPWYYSFLGPGPMATRPNPPIILGSTYDSASVTTPGPPDHLKVVSDDTGVDDVCSSVVARRLVLKIVDINQRNTGVTPHKEFFSSQSSNSCRTDGQGPTPDSCGTDDINSKGEFPDYISVACSGVGKPSCGYTLTDEWQWCPAGQAPGTLATLVETIHNDYITINGVTGPAKLKKNSDLRCGPPTPPASCAKGSY